MKKAKSREEILDSPYVSKTEIQRLTGEGYRTASRIYEMALEKDREELADRLIYQYGEKVRITSVCWVLGIKYSEIKKRF